MRSKMFYRYPQRVFGVLAVGLVDTEKVFMAPAACLNVPVTFLGVPAMCLEVSACFGDARDVFRGTYSVF